MQGKAWQNPVDLAYDVHMYSTHIHTTYNTYVRDVLTRLPIRSGLH